MKSVIPALIVGSLLLLQAQPATAQTIAELYDQIYEASKQKQFSQTADLYTLFFAKKKSVQCWDYFRAAQASAGAGRTDAAFEYLDKMVQAGWLDDEALEKEANLQVLHRDSRWSTLITRVKAASADNARLLNPARVGLANNPTLTQIETWAKDPKVDAATLYARLTGWDQYPTPTERGLFLRFENKLSDTLTAPYFVYIPRDYDPKKRTGLLIWLRGGIGAVNFPRVKDPDYLIENPLRRFLDTQNLIEIFPQGNSAVFWTRMRGMQNITDQLTAVRRLLNVDDDRIFLAGFSNGASGVYAFALNNPSPFAGLFAVNGAINESVYVSNVANRPLYTVASEKDDYSDVAAIKRLQGVANASGASWTVRELPGQEHYFPPYEDEAFPPLMEQVQALKRDPIRHRITWETADTSVGRCDWIQIDALNTSLPRASWHTPPAKPNYIMERNGRIETRNAADDSGAVRATCEKNRFTVETSRVASLTLWLSPALIDFNRPIEVVVNGKRLFQGKVAMDKALIAEQFTQRFDRTQLFAARITLDLKTTR